LGLNGSTKVGRALGDFKTVQNDSIVTDTGATKDMPWNRESR
jgi:hypothetical protein